jgi:hypothetical protein
MTEPVRHDPEQRNVGGQKWQIGEPFKGDPSHLVGVQVLRIAAGDPAFVESQLDDKIVVGMHRIGSDRPHFDLDVEFLAALTDQSLGVRLARLHLATWKFPEKPARTPAPSLLDEDLAAALDQRGHHTDARRQGAPGASIRKA